MVRLGSLLVMARPAPEVHLDDLGVGLHLGDRPFHERPAHVQDGDVLAELTEERHVVLDDDDSPILRDALKEFAGPIAFGAGHSSDRFIEEEQVCVLSEEHADLEPLTFAVRQRCCDHVSSCRESGVSKNGLNHLVTARSATT